MSTILQLAIQNQGVTDNATALRKTWQSFSGPTNVTTWDGRNMFYYKAGVGFNSCALNFQDLIRTNPESGQCGSFAQLLLGSLAINGVQADWVQIAPTDGDQMIVKNFQFTATSFPAQPEFKWKMEVNAGDPLVPTLPGDQFGDLLHIDGLAGQNSPRPSEKLFGFHFIVRALGGYYDRSYGVTYTGERGFETSALEGYAADFSDGTRTAGGRTFVILRARQVNATANITFTVVPAFSN